MATVMAEAPATARVRKLNTASARRMIDPDQEVLGGVGPGQIIPDDLLDLFGVDPTRLSAQQREILSREGTASMYSLGLRIEAILMAGFAASVATADLTDPRTVYMLHEVGEETRHSRLFSRLIGSIDAKAKLPLVDDPRFRGLQRILTGFAFAFGMQFQSVFNALVLTGEEIPDLLQKRVAEHPDADPFLREVSRYHRSEEARHLSFARLRVAELWAESWWLERFAVRRVLPIIMWGLFDSFVHPGMYAEAGLPGLKTWREARTHPTRVDLRALSLRPVLQAMIDGGAIKPGRVGRRWRKACLVDRHGSPLPLGAAA
jgi:hypothetical protein